MDSVFKLKQEIDGMLGAAIAQNAVYWANRAKDPNASKKDKAFARKQLDAALPRSIEELHMMAGIGW